MIEKRWYTGLLVMLLCSCDPDSAPQEPLTVSCNPSLITIEQQSSCVAGISPTEYPQPDENVVFTVDRSDRATIDRRGVISPLAIGDVNVSYTFRGRKSSSTKVTIVQGKGQQGEIMPRDQLLEYGRTSIFEFSKASNVSSWTIEPSEGVITTESGGKFGVTPFIEGNYRIDVKLRDGAIVSKSVQVPKNEIKLKSVPFKKSYLPPSFYINNSKNICLYTQATLPDIVCTDQKAIQIENATGFGSRLFFITPDRVLKSGDFQNNAITNVKEILRDIKQIALYGLVALAVDSNNQVYSWGDGRHGQLGTGVRAYVTTPQKINLKAVRVAVGRYASFAIDESGILYGWGRDPLIGNPNTVWELPRKMMSGVVDVSASKTTLVLRNDKSVWSLGYGDPLGLSASTIPSKIISDINLIAVSESNALAASSASGGDIFAWGSNKNYEIPGFSGDPTTPVNIRNDLSSLIGNIVNLGFYYSQGYVHLSNGWVIIWGNRLIDGEDPKPYVLLKDVWVGDSIFYPTTTTR